MHATQARGLKNSPCFTKLHKCTNELRVTLFLADDKTGSELPEFFGVKFSTKISWQSLAGGNGVDLAAFNLSHISARQNMTIICLL